MSAIPDAALREQVHAVLDPLWQTACENGGYKSKRAASISEGARRHVQKVARERVYKWLAEQMWLGEEDCHVSRFTFDQCHEAMRLLAGITYAEIRRWAHWRDVQTNAQDRSRARHAASLSPSTVEAGE